MLPPSIDSLPFSPSRTVSWIHLGDLHITRSGEQNQIDLGRIVDEINRVYAKGGVDFVFLPGDIADDGSAAAYEVVRRELDRLALPWCGIVGDHDVHEESFDHFQHYISQTLYSLFLVGPYRFLRLNAFSIPKPDSFSLGDEQLRWLEHQLQECKSAGDRAVLLLHCYPSELKQGAEKLKELIVKYPVLLVDMGHTHYNELSNDGNTLYSTTRSTGQVEEGAVGYSLTTLDDDVVSWRFVELGSPDLVEITYPQDERLVTDRAESHLSSSLLPVRVKTWAREPVRSVSIKLGAKRVDLVCRDGVMWDGTIDLQGISDGAHTVTAVAGNSDGKDIHGAIRLRVGAFPRHDFAEVDHDNAIGEWRERGLLGTQLGPNKNGKKW